jgi:hypothetical protein
MESRPSRLFGVLCRAAAAGVLAASVGPPARGATEWVAAGAQYDAPWPHRVVLGGRYRELWTAPVRVERLDLGRFAGGLEPLREVGHRQSRGLALRGADGRSYTFRSTDKDPSALLPEPLRRDPLLRALFRDQTAANHPGAPVVVSALERALGLHAPDARLVVMPDDPRLGPFREELAGALGTIQEYPTAGGRGRRGTFGAVEIVGTEELLARLDEQPSPAVDTRAYLRARLLDLVVGDWDRHRGQWRWARIPRRGWIPLPEDRDLAFSSFEGASLELIRVFAPRLVRFDESYALPGLTAAARPLDLRFLAGLDPDAWEREIAFVTRRLTPEAVGEAVWRLPGGWRERSGPELEAILLERIRRLPDAARAWRRDLVREAEAG